MRIVDGVRDVIKLLILILYLSDRFSLIWEDIWQNQLKESKYYIGSGFQNFSSSLDCFGSIVETSSKIEIEKGQKYFECISSVTSYIQLYATYQICPPTKDSSQSQ